ncbi:acyl-CoA-binding protein (ACBP)/diazepam binding inhibitor (DBI)/endozepine (EP) [Dimargaris verticillata]|uniref:Acyl-CoA-binding protein (ACBP)/diazepam binding inhibitor (DBI)/endozepine (EP) n=1 Tax=Dimargaris verticillata TaxID=2761393 RepID=A0A9W8B719_9FUNG|nr:acyl-CoA-binding protein (ACBP)/diazepam binding inhibitor (DBI)/endozepine (EP) [Dimargaris verticillata]
MSTPESTGNDAFAKAAKEINDLTKKPNNTELLQLYSLFKQGIFGDNTTAQPGMFDLSGKAKWNAWNEKKGKSKADAQAEYIALVEELKAKYA